MPVSGATPSPMVSNVITLYGLKVVRILLSYISLQFTVNYMSQIYMEKVLVNNEEPPSLYNFVSLFAVMDLIMNAVFYAVILFLSSGKVCLLPQAFASIYAADYALGLGSVLLIGSIFTSAMYNKKYFLYKDDGLRAIRALREVFFSLVVLFSAVPFALIMGGLDKATKCTKTATTQ